MLQSHWVTEGDEFTSIASLAKSMDKPYLRTRYHIDRLVKLGVVELVPDAWDKRKLLLSTADAEQVREILSRKKGF